jgi:hypothetical protein
MNFYLSSFSYLISFSNVTNTETQVRYGTSQVSLHQDVLGLQVPVGNGGLTLGAHDGHVEVGEPSGDGEGHVDHLKVEIEVMLCYVMLGYVRLC